MTQTQDHPNDFASRLSKVLLDARVAAGLTAVQVQAAHLGIGVRELSKIESGHRVPRISELRALSKLYGVSMDELCDRAGMP